MFITDKVLTFPRYENTYPKSKNVFSHEKTKHNAKRSQQRVFSLKLMTAVAIPKIARLKSKIVFIINKLMSTQTADI